MPTIRENDHTRSRMSLTGLSSMREVRVMAVQSGTEKLQTLPVTLSFIPIYHCFTFRKLRFFARHLCLLRRHLRFFECHLRLSNRVKYEIETVNVGRIPVIDDFILMDYENFTVLHVFLTSLTIFQSGKIRDWDRERRANSRK